MPRLLTAAASFREKTEDRALVFSAGGDDIVCVADGTGGASGGALAAEMLTAGVGRAVDEHALDVTDPAAWVALLEELDDDIQRHPTAGETTGIALGVTATSIAGASAGDSRAWLFTADGATELTANQVRKPRLGTGRAPPRSFAARASGTLVVGTDGLFDHVAIAAIAAVACRPPAGDAADALIGLLRARFRALPDDVAVVIGWLDAR